MKCLLQAGGDRHWGEGQESGFHRGAGVGAGLTGGPDELMHGGQTVII